MDEREQSLQRVLDDLESLRRENEMNDRIERRFIEQVQRAVVDGDTRRLQRIMDAIRPMLNDTSPAMRKRIEQVIDWTQCSECGAVYVWTQGLHHEGCPVDPC